MEMTWTPPQTRRAIPTLAAVVALVALALTSVPDARAQSKNPPGGGDFGTPPSGSKGSSTPAPAAPAPTASTGDERTRLFAAAPERVFTVARSTLLSLGWKVDKEDRDVGWLLTKSRGVNGEDFGVYAKGTKHRLRVLVKGRDGRSEVTVERRVWKEERILFVDKEEDIATSDRTVERRVLDAIAQGL
jgi:hypothetical protein